MAVCNVYRVPECNLEELMARVEKLYRKAVKLHLDPPRVICEHYEDVPLWRRAGDDSAREMPGKSHEELYRAGYFFYEYRRYTFVRLEGNAPVIPGWKLVAVIEHGDNEVGNVLRVAPGMECPVAYRHAEPLCNHCGHVRRRLETFVLLSPQGEYKQIGRNCLADFCRDEKAAANLCAFAEMLESCRGLCEGAEDAEFFGMGARGVARAETATVLALTARIIRHCGWVSRGKAREQAECGRFLTATADIVSEVFFNPRFFDAKRDDSAEIRALRAAAKDVQEQDVALATAALDWVRAMRPQADQLPDYLYNCLVIASEETAGKKHFGVLCSIVSSYQRELDGRERKAKMAEAAAKSAHLGTIGERRGFEKVTVKALRHFESEYGVRTLARFEDAAGNVLVWWASGEPQWLAEGDTIDITGTVKKHTEFKGIAQTELSRVSEGMPKAKRTRKEKSPA